MGDGASRVSPRVKGVLWYSPEQWSVFRDASSQTDELGDDYGEWREATEAHIQTLERAGHLVVRFDVDFQKLKSWCQAHEIPLSKDASAQFGRERIILRLSLENKAAFWRKLWTRWLAMLISCAIFLAISHWYLYSPFATRSSADRLDFWIAGLTVLLFFSGLPSLPTWVRQRHGSQLL